MLFDPGDASLDWFFPSPAGTRVAYGISFDGDEQSVLHVIETETGAVLPDRIPFTSNATVAWLPDETGFAVNAGTAFTSSASIRHLLVHHLGQAEPAAPEPIEVREPYSVYPQVSGDGRFLVAITSEVEPRADWIRELPDGARRPFLLDVEGTCNGVFDGDAYVAVCTEGTPRGRLVRIPIATATARETWVELIAEGELVLRFVQRAGDLLVVGALREACSVVIVLSPDGEARELELPAAGLVSRSAAHGASQPAAANEGTGAAGDADGFSFVLAAPDSPTGALPLRARVRPHRRAPSARGPVPVRRQPLRGDRSRRGGSGLRGRSSRRSRTHAPGPPSSTPTAAGTSRLRVARSAPTRSSWSTARPSCSPTSTAAVEEQPRSTGTARSSANSTHTTTSTPSRNTSPRVGSPTPRGSPCSAARTAGSWSRSR